MVESLSLRMILSLELWWGALGWLALVRLSGRDDRNDRRRSQEAQVQPLISPGFPILKPSIACRSQRHAD